VSSVLGVDLGTSGVKVGLVSLDGAVLAHAHEPTALRLLPGAGAEQDPDDWWRAIVTATRRLWDQEHVDPSAVVAVCMSGQWGGTVAVDAGGQPVHPALIWMDGRGASHSRRLVGGRGPKAPGTGYSARKLAAWLRRTGGVPSPTGKDPVGQVQWLRHTHPDVDEATRWYLDVPEYLTMRLTGEAVAAFDTAVLRWCTDNRDPHQVRYDDRLVQLCGFDPGKLPPLRPPASVVGRIRPEVAGELGVGPDVQVVTGTGDTTAAAVGAGAVADHAAHLYVGTSAWLSCHVPGKKTSLRTNVAALPAVRPGRYWVANVQDVAGRALTWLAEEVLFPDGPPADALDRINTLAAQAPPGSRGVLFAPWLNGERTPVESTSLRGAWFNLSLTSGRAALVRSVFEGVALNARWLLDAVERFVGRDRPGGFPSLAFVGGGASSPLWCQIMADVLQRPIRQMESPVLANVRGAGLLGWVALGKLTWDDVPARVATQATFTPDPAHRAVYDRLYATFRELHRRTRRLYAAHNRFAWT
jgi:xylulokinase